MQQFEFKAVHAPRRATAKGVKGARTPEDRFARTLTDLINTEAKAGWEYMRADTLPVERKSGMLSSAKEVFQTVLIFRRPLAPDTVTALRPVRGDRAPMSLGPAARED